MTQNTKNISFVVQGEGRGHFSQAIAMAQLLKTLNYSISHVFVGISSARKIPAYFSKSFDCPVYYFHSPNFILDKKRRRLSLFKTMVVNLFHLPRFIKSMWFIQQQNVKHNTHLMINFCDVLGGFSHLFLGKNYRQIVVGHHYYLSSDMFKYPKGNFVQRNLLSLHNYFSSVSASKILALSFMPATSINKKILAFPPLLREEVQNAKPENGDRYLAYFLNVGMAKTFLNLLNTIPNIKIDVFSDREMELNDFRSDNIEIHRIDRMEFVDKLSCCKAVIASAGFDLVAESVYLCKPIYIIPTLNHFEQYCNAIDAESFGLAKAVFALEDLITLLLQEKNSINSSAIADFHAWQKSKNYILNSLLQESLL